MKKKVSFLITTRNRLPVLKETLERMKNYILDKTLEFIICDDGSTDKTYDYIKSNYPSIILLQNKISKGLIYSRNRLFEVASAPYAISLDDDAHIINSDAISLIENFFLQNPNCGVIAFRVYWGKDAPPSTTTCETVQQVKSFVGCGHAWRISSWREISNYPEWFVFYGEEEFASYELFKKGLKVYYFPQILVHHRVNVKDRKADQDYYERLRRSLRAGWYNYFLFVPLQLIPRKFIFSFWMQIKLKVLKGEFRILKPLFIALLDLFLNAKNIIKESNRLSMDEYERYKDLEETKIYWKSENK